MIAIVVSLISICVASLSLGWNIYRDIGLKPRVFVKFGVTYLDFHEDRKSLAISVTNLGRISITVNRKGGLKKCLILLLSTSD
jgi:hypothetical protein